MEANASGANLEMAYERWRNGSYNVDDRADRDLVTRVVKILTTLGDTLARGWSNK